MRKLRVLLVEDEIIIVWDLQLMLEGLECEVVSIADCADAAVEQARTGALDLILMDIALKGAKTGIDAAREIRRFSQVPIIYLTGNTHLKDDPLIKETRAQGMYMKPPSAKQLREMLEIARGAQGGSGAKKS